MFLHALLFFASSAAACNVAIRMLNPKLNRLSLRFSRVFHLDTYNSKASVTSGSRYHFSLHQKFTGQTLSGPLMLGAAATAFYINNAASILPRTVMVKASAYLSGAAADVLEVKRHGDLSDDAIQSLLFSYNDCLR